jgi:hypothetical protein
MKSNVLAKLTALLTALLVGILYAFSQNALTSPMGDPILISGTPGECVSRTVFLDVNNDNHLDHIKSIRYSNKLTVNHNFGDGTFGPETILFDNLNQIFDLHVSDLNADGLEDLMLVTYGNQTLYACLREVDKSLGFPEPVTSVLQESYGCTSGDLDGNGSRDAIALSRNAHHAYWIPFRSDLQEFGTDMYTITTRTYPTYAYSTDFDSDGDTDVLIGHHNSQGIWAYSNSGNGMSWQETNILSGGDAANQIQVIKDGNSTVVFALISGSIRYARWTSGNWTSGSIANISGVSSFSASFSNNSWKVWASYGNVLSHFRSVNNLSSWETLNSSEIGRTYNYLTPPINLSNSQGNQIVGSTNPYRSWSHRESDLGLNYPLTTNGLSGGFPVAFAQADSDDEKEIIARSANSLTLFNRLGSGYWDGGSTVMNGVQVTHMDVLDIDGDGDDDVLMGSNSEDRVAWIECLGNSTYSAVRTLSFSAQAIDVQWRDVNGDGAVDATCITNDDNELLIWYQNPSTAQITFFPPVDLASNVDVASLTAFDWGDIDNDGDVDVVLTAWWNPSFVGIQDSGTLTWHQIANHTGSLGASVNAFDVKLHDTFGDGYPEIFFGSWDYNTSFVNNVNGLPNQLRAKALHELNPQTFSSTTGGSVRSLDLIDINQDGVAELITCRDNAPDGVYAIQFDDPFSPSRQINLIPQVYQGGSHGHEWNIRGTSWSDCDGDSDLDMICVKPATGELYFVENLLETTGCTNNAAINFDSNAAMDDGSCVFAGEPCSDGLSSTYNDQIQADGNCLGQSFNGENILRINCGYTPGPVVDVEGNTWQQETTLALGGGNYWGGGVGSNPNDLIMGHIRYDLIGYNIPVPAPGEYLLRLHFAGMRGELNSLGQQVFHVLVEGDTVVSHLDMFQFAGNRRANHFAIEHFTSTLDTLISLRLPVVTWTNEISGIEVFQYTGDCVDLDLDDVCDDIEIFGCTEHLACNFNPSATENNGSCEIVSCAGCTDVTACNYDTTATYPDASCLYAAPGYGCDGVCLADADGDLICDEFEIAGCTYPHASNYSPTASDDDGSCVFEGVTMVLGCTYTTACNYNPLATFDNGTCDFPSPGRTCNGECIHDSDDDNICDELEGCTIPFACNYNAAAIQNNGCCIFPEPGTNCDGNCIADSDTDGICDVLEVPGCTDENACNFSQLATDDNGSCVYPLLGENCAGTCISDSDDDGICDGNELPGCMDSMACNFDILATEANGQCMYPPMYFDCNNVCINDADSDGVCDQLEIEGCTYSIAVNFNSQASDDDGSCVFGGSSILGCFYSNACNYNPNATLNDGTCVFPSPHLDCNGECLLDCDGDGICDAFEIPGCLDPSACNYLPGATDGVDNCEFVSCSGCTESTACNYDSEALYDNGTCEFTSCVGCMIEDACNFQPEALIPDASCEFLTCSGCTYSDADNFDPTATIDDGSCVWAGVLAGATQTGYSTGYADAIVIAEEECDEEVLSAYNQGLMLGVSLSGSSSQSCGPGTIWNQQYQLCLPEPFCMGDLNDDGMISVIDILLLLSVYETPCD